MLGFTKRKHTNRLSAKKQISPLISDIEDILVITLVEVVLVFSSFCPRPPFLFYPRDIISVVLVSNVCQLTYIFNYDPCNSHDTPQFIGSLTHISTVIVFCRVPNYKPVVINNMPVEGKLIEGSCPCDCRSGIAKYVTFDNSVPCFISGDRFLRFRFKSCWNCKTKENRRKKS